MSSRRTPTTLLPIGLSDEARIRSPADIIAQIAGPVRSTVHVLHVFTDSGFKRIVERLGYDTDVLPDSDDVVTRVLAVREMAGELNSHFRYYGVTVELEGRIADTVRSEITAVTNEIDASRIVVGGQRRTLTGKALFGSTSQDVLLGAPCPVTLVPDP